MEKYTKIVLWRVGIQGTKDQQYRWFYSDKRYTSSLEAYKSIDGWVSTHPGRAIKLITEVSYVQAPQSDESSQASTKPF